MGILPLKRLPPLQNDNFSKWRTRAKFQILFNLATCSNYSITNYVKIPVFDFFFEKVNNGHLKWELSTIKNGRILLCGHFNKIIKEPGTSLKSPAVCQKHVRNIGHTAH